MGVSVARDLVVALLFAMTIGGFPDRVSRALALLPQLNALGVTKDGPPCIRFTCVPMRR